MSLVRFLETALEIVAYFFIAKGLAEMRVLFLSPKLSLKLCFCFSANGLVPIGAPIEKERTSVSKHSQIWLLALQFNGNYH